MMHLPAFDPSQCLILAVDDVPINLKILQGLLSVEGYRMTFATRGQQVLERQGHAQPDLILLDLMMPEMSGLDVCTALKQRPETASIPIIFLTASHEVDHLVQAFAAGAVDYITKPFQAPELLARVRTHLELSQLRKQAQVLAQWESIFRQIVQDIHASIHLQPVLDATVQAIQRLLQAQGVMVCRCSEAEGDYPLAIAGEICPPDRGPIDPAVASALPRHSQKATLCLPIYQQGQRWGELVVQTGTNSPHWGNLALEPLPLIVQQLEISIQHAELHQRLRVANQELKRMSNTDGLTQIANRRYFDQQLAREWRRLRRDRRPLAMILCDIDYFKQFNDAYGHPQGDTCLVAVAQALQGCLNRPADLVARYGGEEFGVLLTNTDLPGAMEVVEQMQRAIAALKIAAAPSVATTYVTLSFGLHAVVPQGDTSAWAALTQADRALYQAKAAGRNQYQVIP
jgi:two-component system, cell cycle response regulator